MATFLSATGFFLARHSFDDIDARLPARAQSRAADVADGPTNGRMILSGDRHRTGHAPAQHADDGTASRTLRISGAPPVRGEWDVVLIICLCAVPTSTCTEPVRFCGDELPRGKLIDRGQAYTHVEFRLKQIDKQTPAGVALHVISPTTGEGSEEEYREVVSGNEKHHALTHPGSVCANGACVNGVWIR